MKKVILLGTDELLGMGAEFPRIALDHKYIPDEFHPHKWEPFMQKVNFDFNIIEKEFNRIAKQSGYDSNLPDIVEFRKGKSWPEILQKRFDTTAEIIVPKLSGQSLFTLSYNLVYGITYGNEMLDFEDAAVILALPSTKRDLMYRPNLHEPGKFENITLWNYALTLSRFKDYVESRLGNFFYFHYDDFPEDFYDYNNNPLLHHIKDNLLFDKSLYSLIPGDMQKRKYDGVHMDGVAHLYLEQKFVDVCKDNDHFNLFR